MSRRADTPETLEPYLILCAELVDEYGPVMQPWLDRMEAEYEAAKARQGKESAAERIRRKLGK